MDLFEFDFFRDWELEQSCHYEQDRNALRRKEWERRNQEVNQDEDLFASSFNLFSEPYKTNKGDALSNRVQSTLGNYDEMKDLLTNRSNQSHLVGIPKSMIPQTPVEKMEQSFFAEPRTKVAQSHQSNSLSSSCMPPPSSSMPSSSSLLHGHQSNKKSRLDWSRNGHPSGGGHGVQANSQPNSQQSRVKHTATLEQAQDRYNEPYCSQTELHKGDHQPDVDECVKSQSSSPNASRSKRHSHSKPVTGDHSFKDSCHVKSPVETDATTTHACGSPAPSTSLIPSGSSLSAQNFPPGLHSKSSMVQQKPTAYVRPMDGQDQAPFESPELKPLMEIEDAFSSQSFGSLLDGKASTASTKCKLPKLTIPQPGEVSLSNETSCVEEILREMTHSWPPPLTAIHTPGKAEPTKFPIPTKDSQHLTSGYNGQKRCDVQGKPPTKSAPQKSMLEDDLKLSSDEDDGEQAEKTKIRPIPVNTIALQNSHSTGSGHSSGGSSSSSESGSSSESDSDSESSSSDSECNKASRNATPEPEPPSTNKWQLDKWLNKVNSHNKAIISNQTECHGLNDSQSQGNQQNEGQSKGKQTGPLPQPDSKERVLLSPIREKAKLRTAQKPPEGKSVKQKSPAHNEPAPQRKNTGKKQPRRVERTSSVEDYNWTKPNNPSSTPKEKESRGASSEQPKAKAKATSSKTGPRKEPRTNTGPAADKKKNRGPSKIVPKSKEFVETDSSDSHTDQEEIVPVKISTPSTVTASLLKPKECGNLSNFASTFISNTSIDQATNDLEEQSFSPIPLPQTELLSPLRDYEEIKSLWVKLDLSLLSRIPGQTPVEAASTKPEDRQPISKHSCQSPTPVTDKSSTKTKRKHKCENTEALCDSKKQRLEKETPAVTPAPTSCPVISGHKTPGSKESSKQMTKKEKKFPPPLSPLPDEPSYKRWNSDNTSLSQESNSNSAQSSASQPAATYKHRKSDSKSSCHAKNRIEVELHAGSSSSIHENSQQPPDPWSSISNGHSEPRRPKLAFDDTSHNADYYMQEAKKLKHRADALLDKFGKAVNYADAALSFIECGNAMERDPLEAKSPYTMYSETVELIRYAMRLKNFTGPAATVADKKLAVLCYRCLSLLYLRMFRLKKDHALKYSRSLMEYFKSSSKASQAPSPWGTNGKTTGTASPMSPTPSPVSSVGSHGSNISTAGSSPSATISIPQRIHHMAASHVNITNNILRSYEHWDTADKLGRENKEFFHELDTLMGPLTQHSSMTVLVRYTRQGLHWLRVEAHLL
ncbi:AF4/FMR2 family member 2 isoform X2 [Callorhinchus milii]|uniref:AF4/FMR2 family member 2 isoform X2 n=1 Tax=Callorhinchus milii TaxID=7868 RepID=UPI000457196A|nr:AF4/FMR2 family member 2 isoform X2 [Callorhinchus milii]|eukprot:gi/632935730/ref/XP_007891077.1/ PREDICTED: AF4/FMR2 family member 2 isoform X2 [Callorhinchus milii]